MGEDMLGDDEYRAILQMMGRMERERAGALGRETCWRCEDRRREFEVITRKEFDEEWDEQGQVICPKKEHMFFNSTALIDEKPPEGCGYVVEHLLETQKTQGR